MWLQLGVCSAVAHQTNKTCKNRRNDWLIMQNIRGTLQNYKAGLVGQKGAALRLTVELNLPSYPFVPPPHHCRQVAAVSNLLDVGSLYKGLLCSPPPGPLDRLSHWVRWQAQVAVPLFAVVTSRHPEGGTSSRRNWHRRCLPLCLLLLKSDRRNGDISQLHMCANAAAAVHGDNNMH